MTAAILGFPRSKRTNADRAYLHDRCLGCNEPVGHGTLELHVLSHGHHFGALCSICADAWTRSRRHHAKIYQRVVERIQRAERVA